MLIKTANFLYPHLSDRFVTATLDYLELPSDDVRASIARCFMQSKGYTLDVPACGAAQGSSAHAAIKSFKVK